MVDWGDLGDSQGQRWKHQGQPLGTPPAPAIYSIWESGWPKLRENHPPTAVPLVMGLASSRGHPAAGVKAGPPRFPPASGTPKGPRRLPHCV